MEQLGVLMENCENESLIPQTIHKNQGQVDRPRYKRQNYKVSTREYKRMSLWSWSQ